MVQDNNQGPLISQQPGYQTDFNQVLSPPQILLIFSPPLRRPHLGSADGWRPLLKFITLRGNHLSPVSTATLGL